MASPPQGKPGAQQICLLLCGVSRAGRDREQLSVTLAFQGSWACEGICEFDDSAGPLVGMSVAGQAAPQILGDAQPGLGRPGPLAHGLPGSHKAAWLVRPRLRRLSAHTVLGHLSSERQRCPSPHTDAPLCQEAHGLFSSFTPGARSPGGCPGSGAPGGNAQHCLHVSRPWPVLPPRVQGGAAFSPGRWAHTVSRLPAGWGAHSPETPSPSSLSPLGGIGAGTREGSRGARIGAWLGGGQRRRVPPRGWGR